MTGAFDDIIDVITDHRQDGFEVPAIEVDPETYRDLCADRSFITATETATPVERTAHSTEPDGDWIGVAAGTDIYVNGDISEPVAADVTRTDAEGQ